MYRKTPHKLPTLLLLLLVLAGAGLSVSPRAARADFDPTTDPPPTGGGDTGIGDPDYPGSSGLPKPSPVGGGRTRAQHLAPSTHVGMQGWVFRFRTVLGVWYRAFLHF